MHSDTPYCDCVVPFGCGMIGFRRTPRIIAVRLDVIIARLMDGERMRIPDKCPLCILYPFDQEEETRSPTYYGRSVWQLQALRVD